ncbi:MAG: T9SS type A sorting domain-containing protein [Bacteroidales bacterium]|nr:T9SS type A sorting domain-containing protein [Bacteroidales bacterium]
MKKLKLISIFFITSLVSFSQIINQKTIQENIIWSEDFSSGIPLGWTIQDNAGIGSWVFIDADTSYGGAYTTTSSGLIPGATPGGYIHLPLDYYNCIPGVYPYQMSTTLIDADASIETNWIQLNGTYNNLFFSCNTNYRYCCSPSNSKLELGYSFNGTDWFYSPLNVYEEIVLVPSQNPVQLGATHPIISLNFEENYVDSIKLKFRMHGASHFFWSIDDIELSEPINNDLKLVQGFAGDTIYEQSSNNYQLNSIYSCVSNNLISDFVFGAKVIQLGMSSQNTFVKFSVLDENDNLIWSCNSDTLNTLTGMYTDSILKNSSQHFYIFNPEINDELNYKLVYKVYSETPDANQNNDSIVVPFKQTLGRYSYHWQSACASNIESYVSPFDYVLLQDVSYNKLINRFYFKQEDGYDFKIYGLRVFIPNEDVCRLTFDANGNGVILSPALLYKNPLTQTISDLSDIVLGDSYQITESDQDKFIYLYFNETNVDSYNFQEGEYYVGVSIEDLNGCEFSIGVDKSYPQLSGHFTFGSSLLNDFYNISTKGGSVMIDAYTDLDYMNSDKCGFEYVDAFNKVTNIKLFPNPTNEIINIYFSETQAFAEIELIDISGRIINSQYAESITNLSTIINSKSGIYFLRVITSDFDKIFKIIKQ